MLSSEFQYLLCHCLHLNHRGGLQKSRIIALKALEDEILENLRGFEMYGNTINGEFMKHNNSNIKPTVEQQPGECFGQYSDKICAMH